MVSQKTRERKEWACSFEIGVAFRLVVLEAPNGRCVCAKTPRGEQRRGSSRAHTLRIKKTRRGMGQHPHT